MNVMPQMQLGPMAAAARKATRNQVVLKWAKRAGIGLFAVVCLYAFAVGGGWAKSKGYLASTSAWFMAATSTPAKTPTVAAPPATKTISCTEWREMTSGHMQSEYRCERWADGRTRETVR